MTGARPLPGLPPPRPIPIRERASILFIEKGRLDVLDGVTEGAVLAAGYAPAIGFLHTGKPQSFVYDMADIVKFDTVVPEAFRVAAAAEHGKPLDGERVRDPVAVVRRRCRDAFRRTNLLSRLIPLVEEVLAAGGLPMPESSPEAMPIAFPDPESLGDAGHRG